MEGLLKFSVPFVDAHPTNSNEHTSITGNIATVEILVDFQVT